VLAPTEHPGALRAGAVIDRREHGVRFVLVDEAHGPLPAGVVAEDDPPALCVDLETVRRHAEAESSVDLRLGGEQGGERLLTRARIVEELLHEAAEHTAATMCREHGDPRHAGGRDRAAGDRDLELVRRREAHRPRSVERADRALEPNRRALALPRALGERLGERIGRSLHRGAEFVEVARVADLEAHYAIFSSGA
jgi:hypothetical protein